MVKKNTGKVVDIGWKYGALEVADNPLAGVKCNFCSKVTKGGITRHKHHLTGTHKDVAKCPKVPDDVRNEILDHMNSKKEAKELMERIPHMDDFDALMEEDDDEDEQENSSHPNKSRGKRSVSVNSSNASNSNYNQPSKRTRQMGPMDRFYQPAPSTGKKGGHAAGTKEYQETQKGYRRTAVKSFCRWMYEAGLPFNAVRYTETLNQAFDDIGKHGPGCKPPSYHEVRVSMLKEEIAHTNSLMKLNEDEKSTYGCNLMADGWKDKKGRALINFLVNTPRGSMFVESVDASDYSHTGEAFFKLFDAFIQKVGPKDVIQVITDSASNNKLAGAHLEEKYSHIYWIPCAAHCLDLMLEDMFKLPDLKRTIERAVQVSTFIYNKTLLLNMMREFTGHRELVRPAKTRFATAFLTLNRMREQKNNLKRMFTSDQYTKSRFAKEVMGKKVVNILMMPSFWDSVAYACKVSGPILSVLRLVDGEKKPPMGYVYKAMENAKQQIAANFNNKLERYREILKIVDERWKCQLQQPLHLAGYYLNPELYYNNAGQIEEDSAIKVGLLSCISKLSANEEEDDAITSELGLYTGAEGIFSTPSAIRQRSKISPAQWWKQYGTSAPHLRKFAIKVLSLTCSSSGCERNWSVFEHLHSKRRNRLEQQKLNDLVYIKYNRTLRRRYNCRDTIDPIVLDDMGVADPNEFLVDVLLDDEDDANGSVFGDGNLSWGVVAEAMGVNEPVYSTRSHSQKTSTSTRKGSSSTPISKAKKPTSGTKYKGKGKAPMVQIDEDEEVELYLDEDDDESEEENNVDAYKDCMFHAGHSSDEENFVGEDDEVYDVDD